MGINKIFSILLKIVIGIISGIIFLIICIYSILWIYVNNKKDNEAIENYKQKINITLTDEQAKIIWYTFTNNKEYKFTWYPLIFDIFLAKDNENIDLITGEMIVGDFRKYKNTLERHFVKYAMKRYVNRKINWKECIEIIVSNMYFGNGLFGIKDASKEYYNKTIDELNEEELIGLIIIEQKPWLEFNSNDFNNETEKIHNNYKN